MAIDVTDVYADLGLALYGRCVRPTVMGRHMALTEYDNLEDFRRKDSTINLKIIAVTQIKFFDVHLRQFPVKIWRRRPCEQPRRSPMSNGLST